MGTFTLTQVHFFFWKKLYFASLLWATLLSYFILMQYKLKCFNFKFQTRRLLFSGQCAMPIRKLFMLWVNSVQGMIKPVGKPVNRFRKSVWNDSFSSLQHALSRLKRFSLRVVTKFKNIKSVERSGAQPFPGGMPLPRHN